MAEGLCINFLCNNLVEAHCYGKGMTGQFLSGHQLQYSIVTDEDLRSRNVLPSICFTATCPVKNCPVITFCASAGPSINCREHFVCPQNLPDIFHASARPSVNLRQLSVHLRNLPSTFCASAELPSNSVCFSCVCGKFEKLRTAIGSSANFSHLSVQSRDYPSAFCASAGHSVNFRQLSERP